MNILLNFSKIPIGEVGNWLVAIKPKIVLAGGATQKIAYECGSRGIVCAPIVAVFPQVEGDPPWPGKRKYTIPVAWKEDAQGQSAGEYTQLDLPCPLSPELWADVDARVRAAKRHGQVVLDMETYRRPRRSYRYPCVCADCRTDFSSSGYNFDYAANPGLYCLWQAARIAGQLRFSYWGAISAELSFQQNWQMDHYPPGSAACRHASTLGEVLTAKSQVIFASCTYSEKPVDSMQTGRGLITDGARAFPGKWHPGFWPCQWTTKPWLTTPNAWLYPGGLDGAQLPLDEIVKVM